MYGMLTKGGIDPCLFCGECLPVAVLVPKLPSNAHLFVRDFARIQKELLGEVPLVVGYEGSDGFDEPVPERRDDGTTQVQTFHWVRPDGTEVGELEGVLHVCDAKESAPMR